MEVGLLTFDSEANRSFQKKVALAVVYYRRKYGVLPDVVYVHPDTFAKYVSDAGYAAGVGEVEIGGIAVKSLRTVLKHHFWTGIEDTE